MDTHGGGAGLTKTNLISNLTSIDPSLSGLVLLLELMLVVAGRTCLTTGNCTSAATPACMPASSNLRIMALLCTALDRCHTDPVIGSVLFRKISLDLCGKVVLYSVLCKPSHSCALCLVLYASITSSDFLHQNTPEHSVRFWPQIGQPLHSFVQG